MQELVENCDFQVVQNYLQKQKLFSYFQLSSSH